MFGSVWSRRWGVGTNSSPTARSWGPALVFERLWQAQRLPEILSALSEGRRFAFDIERACFALALQRLCAPGSDLQGSQWLHTIECRGFESLELQHLYRTVGGFLAPVRTRLEHELFVRDRDLFSQKLDLVFIDTTSTMIWRDEQTPLRRRDHDQPRRGRSRRPLRRQVRLANEHRAAGRRDGARTRASGASSVPSEKPSPRSKSAPSSITVTIRRSATSSAVFSHSVSKWICSAASSSARSTSHGPT